MKNFFILLTAILILSSIATAQETNNTRVAVATKQIGYDNNTGKTIAIVGIHVDKLGHLQYFERYYQLNESNVLGFKKMLIYNDSNITNNNLSFKILRPVDPSGKPYYIKARIVLDNETILDDWLIMNKPNNGTNKNSNPPVTKKTSGFMALSAIAAIGLIMVMGRRKPPH